MTARVRDAQPDFFPLTPLSSWEYAVTRQAGSERVRFIATVQPREFMTPDGRGCTIVDERYSDLNGGERFPVVYCVEGGYLHRLMSFEYRDDALQDNGLRSGELRFLPIDLVHTHTWEGRTNAYRLPDGSGLEVRQLHDARVETEAVLVPAGQFERCVRVDTTAIHSAVSGTGAPVGSPFVFYYSDWYASGVGLVRTEQRNSGGVVLATIELVHYEIGREAARR